MNKVKRLGMVFWCMMAIPAWATFSTATGYQSTELFTTSGTFTTCGGLALTGDELLFGNYTEIKAVDTQSLAVSTFASLPSNAGIAAITDHSDLVYTAYGTSYSSPYPYTMGYFDAAKNWVSQTSINGIYDAAINPGGLCYIVANPSASGSRVYQYDWNTGETVEIANIGGYSGGLTFDAQGNLYYADQGLYDDNYNQLRAPSVLKFTAAQLDAGSLTASDATTVLDITARFIRFDDLGSFYATTGYGSLLACYDLTAQRKLYDIAYGGIDQFTFDGQTIYAIDTDWYDYYSTVQKIESTPEPATLALLLLGSCACLHRRQNKSGK